jgi:hypothetical protein
MIGSKPAKQVSRFYNREGNQNHMLDLATCMSDTCAQLKCTTPGQVPHEVRVMISSTRLDTVRPRRP